MRGGEPESPLYPRKQTLAAENYIAPRKRTSDVRFAPKSGRKWLWCGMSAFDPQATFAQSGELKLNVDSCTRFRSLLGFEVQRFFETK
jgi:hypothetical protein